MQELVYYFHKYEDEFDFHGLTIDEVAELIYEESWSKWSPDQMQRYIDEAVANELPDSSLSAIEIDKINRNTPELDEEELTIHKALQGDE